MLNVEWRKCKNKKWCELFVLDASATPQYKGIYIIWIDQSELLADGAFPDLPHITFIDVGSGIIRERIKAHQNDEVIQDFASTGHVYATWAPVDESYLLGVESFLADALGLRESNPKKRYPTDKHVLINIPNVSE